MQKPQPVNFRRLVVLYNPKSSNAGKVNGICTKLDKAFPGMVITRVLRKTDGANTNLLKNTLRSGDILLVCGGDGTVSTVINYMLSPDMPAGLQRIPILPVGTGRMNDFARILNGRYFGNPAYVLKHARAITVRALKCVCTPLQDGNKPLVKTSVYNIGFGYSGEGSTILNTPAYRAKPQIRSSVMRPMQFVKDGWDLLKNVKHFGITIDGKRRTVIDISAANGHILYGYWRVPAKLSEDKFCLATMDDKSALGAAKMISDMATKRIRSGTLVNSASFVLHDPTTGHIGGETFTPPTPCKVDISLHEPPITLLATSPKA